jgi:hypothetical protein
VKGPVGTAVAREAALDGAGVARVCPEVDEHAAVVSSAATAIAPEKRNRGFMREPYARRTPTARNGLQLPDRMIVKWLAVTTATQPV